MNQWLKLKLLIDSLSVEGSVFTFLPRPRFFKVSFPLSTPSKLSKMIREGMQMIGLGTLQVTELTSCEFLNLFLCIFQLVPYMSFRNSHLELLNWLPQPFNRISNV